MAWWRDERSRRFLIALTLVTAGMGSALLVVTAVVAHLGAPVLVVAACAGAIAAVTLPGILRTPRTVALVVLICCVVSPAAVPALWIVVYRLGALRRRSLFAVSVTAGAVAQLAWTAGCVAWLTDRADATGIVAVGILSYSLTLGTAGYGVAAGIVFSRTEETVRAVVRRDFIAAGRARASERERLSRELHDVLGHRLALINIYSAALAAPASSADRATRDIATTIGDHIHGAVDELGELVAVLQRASAADEAGPEYESLDVIFGRFREAGMHLSVTRDFSKELAAPAQARTVERFCREGLTNALKYAASGVVSVEIRFPPDSSVTAVIRSPFDGATRSASSVPGRQGVGIAGLEQRAALLGGSVWVELLPNHHDLHLWLPPGAVRSDLDLGDIA